MAGVFAGLVTSRLARMRCRPPN